MQIKSSAFKNGEKIPSLYTCDGKNINFPLEFVDVSPMTKSFVLVMEDPDVPSYVRKDGLWVHWLVYNIPPTLRFIEENTTPPGIVGKGTGGVVGYQGPCPPDREHRYFVKLYALNAMLALEGKATKDVVENQCKGHIIEQAELLGLYVRGGL
jgi:Raf kinase inhibitor-like YbhB/YbcL family protein